jgi:hypothetical protein
MEKTKELVQRFLEEQKEKEVLREKTSLEEMSLQHLQEMATVCKKKDGFGIIIEVHSDDHGILAVCCTSHKKS